MSHTSGIVFGVVLLLFVVSILGERNPDLGMPGVGNPGAASSTMDTQTGSQMPSTGSVNAATTTEEVDEMVGESLKVLLDGNSGTGYIWEVVTSQTSPSLQTSAVTREETLNSVPWARVNYAVHVVPQSSGRHTLTLRYFNPSAPTNNPTFKTVTINVMPRNELHLEPEATTHTISGVVGSKILLSLDGNPTTGYGWEVVEGTSPSLRTGAITQKPRTPNLDGVVGVGEKYGLSVVPTQAGTQMLTLRYFNPSAPTNNPTSKTVTINVMPRIELHLEPEATTHTISGVVGSKILLSLDGNPTTGYGWEVIQGTSPSLWTGAITQKPRTPNLDGVLDVGEKYSLSVVPTQAGTQMLILRYAQSWDVTNHPMFKDVTINVAPLSS